MDFTRELLFGDLVSAARPVLIFKHSTRCSISSMALSRIERRIEDLKAEMDIHLIDVIQDRSLSLSIASHFDVEHQSPQAILLAGGEVVHVSSHGAIAADTILAATNK